MGGQAFRQETGHTETLRLSRASRARLTALVLVSVLLVAGCVGLPAAGDQAVAPPSRAREPQAGGGGGM